MVVWKEGQHKYDDSRDGADVASIVALRGFGILNIFHVSSMKSHVILVECILRMWNPE